MRKIIIVLMLIFLMIFPSCSQENTGTTCAAGGEISGAEQAETLSDEPPLLTVTCGDISIEALRGGYHWESYMDGEMVSAVIADCAHPLQCRDIMPVIFLGEERNAVLTFGGVPQPDKLDMMVYSTDDWDNMEALSKGKAADIMTASPPEIRLDKDTVYVINAEWNSENGYGGRAEYSFYAE